MVISYTILSSSSGCSTRSSATFLNPSPGTRSLSTFAARFSVCYLPILSRSLLHLTRILSFQTSNKRWTSILFELSKKNRLRPRMLLQHPPNLRLLRRKANIRKGLRLWLLPLRRQRPERPCPGFLDSKRSSAIQTASQGPRCQSSGFPWIRKKN